MKKLGLVLLMGELACSLMGCDNAPEVGEYCESAYETDCVDGVLYECTPESKTWRCNDGIAERCWKSYSCGCTMFMGHAKCW